MKKRIFTCAIILTIALTGCSPDNPPDTKEADQKPVVEESIPAPVPTPGGNLNISMRNPVTLNPLLNDDPTVDRVLKLLFEPLMTLDETQKPVPNLAESCVMEGSTVTIKLKPNIRWHNGAPITAEDVLFSIQVLKNNASDNAIYKKNVENIATASKIDESTVKLLLKQNFSGQLYSLCFPLIPAAHYQGLGNAMEPLGSGLYSFESFSHMKEMVLRKSANSLKEEAYIDMVTVLITPDADTDLHSFSQNILDVVVSGATRLGTYGVSGEIATAEFVTNEYEFIGFNFNRLAFQDKNVRRAIAHCMPLQEVINDYYLSHAVPCQTPISPQSFLYDPNAAAYAYDMERADSLLTESGWKKAGDTRTKMINETEHSLTFTILVNEENVERRKVADRLSEELKTVGISLTVMAVPFEEYKLKLTSKDFDMFIGGWQLAPFPDLTFAFHSSKINETNYIGYTNQTMDSLLAGCFNAPTEQAMITAYSSLQKHIVEEVPYISIAFKKSLVAVSNKVHGDITPYVFNLFYNINEWFITEQ